MPTSSGQSVPLEALASYRYEVEPPIIGRRVRLPTVTIKAAVVDDLMPASIAQQLAPKLAAFNVKLAIGHAAVIGAAVEESAKAQAPIAKVAPLMVFVMLGIIVGTGLTLLFRPALYLIWFRIPEPTQVEGWLTAPRSGPPDCHPIV